jgi:hypothetical protein
VILEPPKAAALDGTLAAGAVWVVTHFEGGLIWALTIAILIVRLMILWRKWKTG